jgi:hypothetical protein
VLVDHHLAGHAGLGRAAVQALEHRALDLHPGHRGLHEDLGVVRAGRLDGLVQAVRVGDPGDPDARAAAGRLDEHRPAQLGDLVQDALALAEAGPVAVADHHVAADRQAARGQDQLHVLLVHAGRAGEHARARVPGAGHLQQTLQRAVLAERPVQQRQHHVDLAEVAGHLARRAHVQRAGPGRDLGPGNRHRIDRGLRRSRQREPGRVARGEDPPAVGGDADGKHVVTVPVDGREHQPRARARHGVFCAAAAEHHGDPDLPRHASS